MHEEDKMPSRVQNWFVQSKCIVGYNSREKPLNTTHQIGGTGILLCNDLVPKYRPHDGIDILGRWTSIVVEGKANIKTRFVSVYGPHKAGGVNSAVAQHRNHYLANNITEHPRVLFWQEITQQCNKWKEQGEQLIIGGDWNSDSESKEMKTFAKELNLRHAYCDLHGAPPTSRYPGKRTIDSIWITNGIEVTKASYTSVEDSVSTDHRALWLEISYISAFGTKVPRVINPQVDRINCQDPLSVTAFNNAYRRLLLLKRVPQLLGKLQQSIIPGRQLTLQQQQQFELIDKLKITAIQEAQRKCRKLYMGGVPYSATIIPYWRAIEAWTLAVRRHSTTGKAKSINSRYWTRTLQNANIQKNDPRLFDADQCIAELKAARNRYNIAKKNSLHYRTEHLTRLATRRARVNNTHVTSEIKALQLQEETRREHRKIKFVLQKYADSGVSSVEVTTADGNAKELSDKTDIENALCRENSRKYKMAYNTPILQSVLRKDFGTGGLTTAAQQVTCGKYTPSESLSSNLQEFLHHFQQTPSASKDPPSPSFISLAEFQAGWKRAKATTSSNPDGPGYSVYKAIAADNDLSAFKQVLINIPYQTGYSPHRWRKALDVMLKKKANSNHITKLRTIGLQEADFNFLCKHMGKWAMAKAEKYRQLAKEQYGSRKGHTAIAQALNKRLTMDMAMLTKVATIFCSQDAMSCYDRISHAALSMGLRRQNIPESAIQTIITTIQNMVHKVRTVFGESELSYGGDPSLQPLQGIPQGNGMGPPGWSIISSPLLEILRSSGFGAQFSSPMTRKIIKFVGYAYVDDTDQVETEKIEGEHYSDILKRMQKAVDTWEEGITATGGAIRPEKCHWYLLEFLWDGSTWKLATTSHSPGVLTVRDSEGQRKTIARKEPHESEVTLGVHCSPDGNMKHQVQRMLAQSTSWGEKISVGKLHRTNVGIALRTTIWKTLGYPLSATLLSKSECETIMRPALNAALPRMGLNRHFPRELVFAPKEYQGLSIPHLHTLQGIAHLKDIINHQLRRDLTSDLHRSSFEALFLLTGMGSEFLLRAVPGADADLPRTIATCVRDFCITNSIEVKTNISAPLLRRHDTLIMPLFLTSQFSDYERQIVNRCRIYLNLLSVAELTSGDGNEVLSSVWNGRIATDPLRNFKWPYQSRPPESEWRIWRRCLAQVLCNSRRYLNRPLGDWTHTPSNHWLHDPHDSSLYYHGNHSEATQRWVPINRKSRGRQRRYHTTSHVTRPPPGCHIAVCIHQGSSMLYTGSAPKLDSRPPPCRSLPQILSSLPQSLHWALQHTSGWENTALLLDALRHDSLIGVTDGSFKNSRGAAHWIICDERNPDIRLSGSLLSPGRAQYQQSTRAELAGMYGISAACYILSQHDDAPSKGFLRIGCDSKEAIRKISPDFRLSATTPDYDVASSVLQLIHLTPWEWRMRHVYGHQDSSTKYDDLDLWARLNVDCDTEAGIFRQIAEWDQVNTDNLPLWSQMWQILLHNQRILHDLDDAIYAHCHRQSTYQYWSKHSIHPDALNEVNWPALGLAARRSTTTRLHWSVKNSSGWLPHNSNKFRWQMHHTQLCSSCPAIETTNHIYSCSAPPAIARRVQILSTLPQKLRRLGTAPNIITALLQGLRSIWTEAPCHHSSHPLPLLSTVLQSQSNIGWWQLICGKWTIYWQQAQQAYYDSVNSPKSSLRWQTALIQLLWDTAWDMWDFRNQVTAQTTLPNNPHDQLELDEAILRQWHYGAPTQFEQHYFQAPLNSLLRAPRLTKRRWLDRVRSSLSHLARIKRLRRSTSPTSRPPFPVAITY